MTILKFADDGVWTWFHDPRAVHHDGKTYVTWFAHTGIWVGSRDDATGEVETFKLIDISALSSLNDHLVAALGIRPDGRIIACYADHGFGPMWIRISTNPGDVTSWSEQGTVPNTGSITYPMLEYLSAEGTGQGRWYLSYRTYTGNNQGGRVRAIRTSDDGGETWTAATVLVQDNADRPYLKMKSNGVDTIHFTVTDGHPRTFTTNSVYHFWYHDGEWMKSDGTSLSPGFLPSACTKIYDGTTNRGWLWDICADPDTGHPVVTFQARHSPLDIRYHYARWNGSEWSDHEVVSGGRTLYNITGGEDDYAGGMMLNYDDPSIAYVSRVINGVHELERWITPDGGASWTSEPITTDSGTGVKNFRPYYVTDGPLELVWCRGPYVSYGEFSTDIYALTRTDATPSRRRGASILGGII